MGTEAVAAAHGREGERDSGEGGGTAGNVARPGITALSHSPPSPAGPGPSHHRQDGPANLATHGSGPLSNLIALNSSLPHGSDLRKRPAMAARSRPISWYPGSRERAHITWFSKVGETVVYPHHGAALIEEIIVRSIRGEEKVYLKLKVARAI